MRETGREGGGAECGEFFASRMELLFEQVFVLAFVVLYVLARLLALALMVGDTTFLWPPSLPLPLPVLLPPPSAAVLPLSVLVVVLSRAVMVTGTCSGGSARSLMLRTRVESSRQNPGRRSWCWGVGMRGVFGRTVLSRQAAACCEACDVVAMKEGRMEEESG